MAVAVGVDITVGDGVSVGAAVGVSDLTVGEAVGTNRATVRIAVAVGTAVCVGDGETTGTEGRLAGVEVGAGVISGKVTVAISSPEHAASKTPPINPETRTMTTNRPFALTPASSRRK